MLLLGIIFIYPVVSRKFPDLFGGFNYDIYLNWPVILIVIGLIILIKGLLSKRRNKIISNTEDDVILLNTDGKTTISKNLIFGSSEEVLLSLEFRRADLNVAFGEIKIDMRKIGSLNENNLIEANAIFGSIIIYLPDSWNVSLNVDSIFAGVQDKRTMSLTNINEDSPLLNIKGGCIFGSIEIRN